MTIRKVHEDDSLYLISLEFVDFSILVELINLSGNSVWKQGRGNLFKENSVLGK